MWRTNYKCVIYTLVVILLFLVLLPFVLYIPAVQQGMANYATRAASEQMGMQIELERVRVRFPLDVELENALVVSAPNDTMLQCEALVLDLGFKKILQREIEIEKLSFEKTKFHYSDSFGTFDIKVNVDELNLMARPVNLINERAVLPDISLTGGDVILHLVSAEEDTTTSSPSFAWAFEVGNIHLKDISYVMTTAPHETSLQSAIDEAHLCSALVDIGKQSVTLSKARIQGALCKYLSRPGSGTNEAEEENISGDDVMPWTINVDSLSLLKSNVTYGQLNYTPKRYFDPSYISLYNLNIDANDIFNRASEVKVNINHLSFYERSGISVSHANASLLMNSSKIAVDNLYLATLNSSLKGSLEADASILQQDRYAQLRLNMGISLQPIDAIYFIPSISDKLSLLSASPIDAKIDVGGNLSTLHLKELSLSVPDKLRFNMEGDLSNIISHKPVKARATLHGKLMKGSFVQPFIGDSSSVVIPDNIALNGKIELDGDSLRTKMGMHIDGGKLFMRGALNISDMYYNLSLALQQIPLGKILKGSDFGTISSSLFVRGVKFNPMERGAKTDLSLQLDTLRYNRYNYTGANLKLQLAEGVYNGTLTSSNQDLNISLDLNGVLTEEKQTVNLKGDIPNIDLQQLNFSTDKLSVTSSVDISASADTLGIYSVKGGLGTTTVRMYGAKRTLPGLAMDILADTSQVKANVEAKGLYLDFYSPVSINSLVSGIDTVMVELKRQNDSLMYNIGAVKEILPPCNLSLSVDDNPLISAFLKRNGITMGLTELSFSSEHNSPLYLNSKISYLSKEGLSIDSICANLNQDKEALDYRLSVSGIKESSVNGSSIVLNGEAQNNVLTLNCLQTDDKDCVGFDFGTQLLLKPQLLELSFTTPKPVLGYQEFLVNEGNYITYGENGKVDADFVLTSGEKLISLKTQNDTISNTLLVKLQQLDIASLLKLWPLAPDVEGMLYADMGLNLSSKGFGARGSVSVDSLVYEGSVVGDLNLKAGYKALQEGGQQVGVSMSLNDADVVKLGGRYNPESEEDMRLNLSINSLPLSSINPFIPDDLLLFTGALNGDFSLIGKENDIKMNGFLQFDNVDMTIPMIGTTFTLSPEKVLMTDNKITMYNFGMSGPNKKPMVLEGSVDLGNISETLSDYGKIKSDILITASNFQLINVKKNSKTLVYGKAFSDMFLVIQGPMNNLTLGGNVALLNGTELTYTMRDGGMGQQEDVSDLVTFTAFTDTLNLDEIEVKHNKHWGVDASLGISIGQAVKVALNLTPDAKSGIDIQGGGELLYTMNMLGDTHFTGKYNIVDGSVRYTLPVVATKVFTIDDGSYIEWNGDIADPTMNITAQNKVRATVSQGGVSNMVNFYVIIGIKNSLEDLDLSFDLEAPEDMTITNELASMSEDQRSEQALSMLLYNTYTGVSGTESPFDANSALGSFLSKELNQWANKTLTNVDLTFGVDRYTSATGESTLDYSYEFSKSLLDDRLRVAVGGSYNPDLSPNEVAQSILGDVSLEYQLDSRDNMLIKVFRSSTNDMLEGNISEYGVGFAVRKQVLKLKELFQITGRKEKIEEKKKEKRKKRETKTEESDK